MNFLFQWVLDLFKKPETEVNLVSASWPFPPAPIKAQRKKKVVKKTVKKPVTKKVVAKKATKKKVTK